jgi:hypothetical protein
MKKRLITGLVLLMAYPLAVGILIALERHQMLRHAMVHVDYARFISGLLSFAGFAVLIAEYQSEKQTRQK